MSAERTYNQIVELLPLYVLGVLEPDEMLAVNTAVQRHPELQVRLNEIEDIMVQLTFAAPAVPLPPDARQRLLDRVHADTTDVASLESTPELLPTPQAVAVQPPRTQHTPKLASPLSAQRGWFAGSSRWALGTLCLLVALVVLGGYTRQLQNQLAQVRAETVALRQTNQRLQDQVLRGQEYVTRVIEANRGIVLASTQPGLTASGVFTLEGERGELVVSGLAPLPPDQTYQAWLMPPGGTPTSIGLLAVQADGTATLSVTVPAELRNFSIANVSIEKAGGSDVITKETIVLRGTLS